MRHHRFITIAGAGAALAASIALTSFLIFPGDSARVEAATIFQSFRDAFKKAFVLRMENIVDEGYRLDGEVLVILADEGEAPDPAADSIISGDLQEKGAYIDMTIRGEEDSDAPGLLVDVVLAAAEGNSWTYLKTDIPAQLTQNQPFVAWLAGWARDGLFIDLGDTLENEAFMRDVAANLTSAEVGENGIEGPSATMKLKFSMGSETTQDDDGSHDGHEDGETVGEKFSIVIGSGNDLEAATKAATGSDDLRASRQVLQVQAMQAGADAFGISYDEMVQLTELINALFTGRMTAEQTDKLVSWLERSAQDVTITQRQDGLYVLKADRLDLSSLPMDEEALAELSQNSFEIGYRPETGVEYAAVLNVGSDNGRMVFEFVDRDINDEVFDSRRYTEDANVRKLDLNKAFGGLFSNYYSGKTGANQPAPTEDVQPDDE